MSEDASTGIALSRAFFEQVVAPIMTDRFRTVPYAAARIGSGSDVLGLDDSTSRDHDWGLRLSLFVPEERGPTVHAELERILPATFRGLPTRFTFTGETDPRHHIDVSSVTSFAQSHLGFNPLTGVSVTDWLSMSGQAVLEVTAGPIFVDQTGELQTLRRTLSWYPDDLWRYVLACDWTRIAQELPLMARAADVGDDVGSRVIAARLVQIIMHLVFLLNRRWPPYSKWFGTAFKAIPGVGDLSAQLERVLGATALVERQSGIACVLDRLLQQQNALGLSASTRATVPFWERPHLHPNPMIVTQLLASIADPEVGALPTGRGSIDQRTDNADMLTDPRMRRTVVTD